MLAMHSANSVHSASAAKGAVPVHLQQLFTKTTKELGARSTRVPEQRRLNRSEKV